MTRAVAIRRRLLPFDDEGDGTRAADGAGHAPPTRRRRAVWRELEQVVRVQFRGLGAEVPGHGVLFALSEPSEPMMDRRAWRGDHVHGTIHMRRMGLEKPRPATPFQGRHDEVQVAIDRNDTML